MLIGVALAEIAEITAAWDGSRKLQAEIDVLTPRCERDSIGSRLLEWRDLLLDQQRRVAQGEDYFA